MNAHLCVDKSLTVPVSLHRVHWVCVIIHVRWCCLFDGWHTFHSIMARTSRRSLNKGGVAWEVRKSSSLQAPGVPIVDVMKNVTAAEAANTAPAALSKGTVKRMDRVSAVSRVAVWSFALVFSFALVST